MAVMSINDVMSSQPGNAIVVPCFGLFVVSMLGSSKVSKTV